MPQPVPPETVALLRRRYAEGATLAVLKAESGIASLWAIYRCLDGKYDDLRPGLRMNIIGNPGVDKANFELWSFAVSSINGCSHCVVAHEHTLREAGVDRDAILEALKVAAIVSGVAQATVAAETLASVG